VLADVLCTLGRDDEAESLAREVARSAPEDDLAPQVLWRSSLGRVLVRRGELPEAERLAEDATALTEGVEFPDLRVAALVGAAEVAAARHRHAAARRLLADARAILAAKGNLPGTERLDGALAELVR